MNLKQYDALIFDLDGTLWDTSATIDQSWNKALSSFADLRDSFSLDEILSIMGKHHGEILEQLFPNVSEERANKCLMECYIAHRADIRDNNAYKLYDDVERGIAELARTHKLYLVSNCDQPYLNLFLNKFSQSSNFDATLCHGATGNDKAANIRQIVDRHNLQKPVYIGDTQTDSSAAKTAKTAFVFANYGFGSVDEFDHEISHFTELFSK